MTALAGACPVCGEADRLSKLCVVDGFDIMTCAACRADFAQPMPSAAELKKFYDRPEWFEGGEKGGYDNYDAQTDATTGVLQSVLERFAGRENLMVLDVGCGYGTHLKLAADRGWTCVGVEISDHAREKAKERLGPKAYIVGSTDELFSHKFDLVLILDTLEHLPSPYKLFYQLYSIGAIGPDTLVVITTPNAGSAEARRDPAAWAYRHPPSHLVYYTADALTTLLRRLHFKTIDIRGTGGADETDLAAAPGLLVTASGSDFMQFMHERYVPGTWSKIAEYEHMPRYALAADLAAGKRVLDFGCGTGYGAAMLANAAAAVTGLDIDSDALTWAREVHRNPRLTFVQSADLGAALPSKSFDLITCFEMIEHVDHTTQMAAVAGFERMLRPDGVLLISTPNPEVTKLYDANPYHLREMTEAEFRELLSPHFAHIQILRQHLQPGVAFEAGGAGLAAGHLNAGQSGGFSQPLAYIAVCSHKALPAVTDRVFFDTEGNFVEQFIGRERHLNLARFHAYRNGARAKELEEKVATLYGYLADVDADREAVKADREAIIQDREAVVADRELIRADREEVKKDRQTIIEDRERVIEDRARIAAHRDAIAAENARLQTHIGNLDLTLRTREEQLRSPKFLVRQLLHAIKQRLLKR